jgi:hypothetical protein
MFIATANVLQTIPSALQERMEILNSPLYRGRKTMIAKIFYSQTVSEHGFKGRTTSITGWALKRSLVPIRVKWSEKFGAVESPRSSRRCQEIVEGS